MTDLSSNPLKRMTKWVPPGCIYNNVTSLTDCSESILFFLQQIFATSCKH